jgi:hypothetical protein
VLVRRWADGPRKIHDDGGARSVVDAEFPIDGGKGAQEQIVDVGEDGSAARGDAILGEEHVQLAEGMVDAGGSLEVFGVAGKGGGEIGDVGILVVTDGVLETEAGIRVGDGLKATAAAGGAMLAMRLGRCGAGVRGLGIHDGSFSGRVGIHPRCFCKSGKYRSCRIRRMEESMKNSGEWRVASEEQRAALGIAARVGRASHGT